jgi:hypothetical protein
VRRGGRGGGRAPSAPPPRGPGGAAPAPARRFTLEQPIRSGQQTLVGFGERSHWLQPWRGYLQTTPAARVLAGVGIVFNPPPADADKVAGELAAAGFHRARLELSWCRVSYDDPEHITGDAGFRTLLKALQHHRLRPLVLLNANAGCPGPLQQLQVRVTAAAHRGARQLTLDPASIARVVPGHTGLDSTTGYKAAAVLFTSVHGDTVTLSKPLDADLAAGSYAASTLKYEPFTRPGDDDFERTMTGWLRYVGLATHEAKSILGSQRFDVEVWNELSFGSDFLDADTYYDPAPAPDAVGKTEQQLLARTVAYIRDPAHGVSHVGIGDGFANERPWDSGATVPRGLTAIDKHPYPPRRTFPGGAVFNGVRPLDALGRPDGRRDAHGDWHDSFVPHYTAFFPEYYLTAIQTESAIRDLSPLTTTVYGTPHGRATHPPGSAPPATWVTEAGLDPAGVPAAALPRFHAKGALRWLVAWLGKGAAAVYLYAAASPGWGVVDADAPGGGPTLRAVAALTRALRADAAPVTRARSVRIVSISDTHDHEQFAGDGTRAHPPLYDRDVVGFFPFQSSNRSVVVPTYVMTRDLLHVYDRRLAAGDPRRYDLPPEWFRLTIAGVHGLDRRVALRDPLTGRRAGVRVVRRTRGTLVVDVALTDYPRLLELSGK